MEIRFISLSIPLQNSPVALREQVETVLRQQGEPLRWAVTAVNALDQTAQVEAVVTVTAKCVRNSIQQF